MAKKIFDIFPPKTFTIFRGEKAPPPVLKAKMSGAKGLIFIPLFLILVILFLHFVLSKVEIEIWPEAEILNFREKVTIDVNTNQVAATTGIIPGKIFEEVKSISQQFPSSGKSLKEKRAEGIIRVYNNYSTLPQVLVATTRFISAEGKLFRSLERVTIPGGRYEKGKLAPGYLDIKVRAAEPGKDYNIGPSTFSIPGFAGTPRYTAFYGKSFSAMEGGFRGEVSQVTKEDLDRAKEILVDKLFRESKSSLKNRALPDFILIDAALLQEVIEASSLAKAGTEIDSFNYQVKVRSKAIVFKKSDLENFAKEFVRANIFQDKKLQEESLKINYSPESINVKLGKVILNLEISAKIYSDIEKTSLKRTLLGKSLKEAQRFLEDSPKITKINLEVFPFWLRKIPQKEEKIKVKLNLD